ncbi:maleylacetoacetate isomerase [Chromobacterium sphagni]|uniref:Maleylacetoacetate isomerase n=1 Tax=Chromobacterium sphagni TaxID=1903179 RepID=A0A1S1X3F0_9NEIS|nr:maleylacetoacetate isomerase [Chromobacterium sphagni]OHX13935.1 maleylacetoacetate isomerase [Chromobacterium sphagni]OHX20143.1 maleylacetoacetate isomerase [Chromobacterium sphagni]
MAERVLYGYFRSSAAYRVRIALNLKGLAYRQRPVNLLKGEQKSAEYLALNPHGMVPLLDDGGVKIVQSLAICEYLDDAYPDTARLLPSDPVARARARSIALAIAADIHPLQNPRVGKHLQAEFGVGEDGKTEWIRHWIRTGFDALEQQLAASPARYAAGDEPTLADVCLLPQVFSARRFAVDLAPYPHIVRIAEALDALPAFADAHPAKQPDAV